MAEPMDMVFARLTEMGAQMKLVGDAMLQLSESWLDLSLQLERMRAANPEAWESLEQFAGAGEEGCEEPDVSEELSNAEDLLEAPEGQPYDYVADDFAYDAARERGGR